MIQIISVSRWTDLTVPDTRDTQRSRLLKLHGIPNYVNFTVGILIKCLNFSSSSIWIKRLDTNDSPDNQVWEQD